MVPFLENAGGDMMVPKINVPVGHWKDDLSACFTYGQFHNHCCISCFCPLRVSLDDQIGFVSLGIVD
jgi:hypothetical protein